MIKIDIIQLILIIFSYASIQIYPQVTLPSLFCDNMILQQKTSAPVWGWADPGTKVVVSGSWNNTDSNFAITDAYGNWMVEIITPEAGGPYSLSINKRTINNVMIGEVWICSGQSNMQWRLDQTDEADEEIKNAVFPNVRLFYVARDNSDNPNTDVYGAWEECNPSSAKSFSAVAYYFGKELYTKLNIPIGLIHVSWGGSTAQAWINKNILQSTKEGKYYIDEFKEKIKNTQPGINPRNHQSPSGLYNAMLKPLIPYSIKGAIWYQGESNVSEHYMYKKLMEILISSWRDEWNQGPFPFYFVQLAPFKYQQEIVGAALRDEQRRTLTIPNTGMAVTLDIGNPNNIHPTNKLDVGKRLAYWALAKNYGNSELVYSGPLYKSFNKEGQNIRVYFDNVGSGLICKGEKLTHFTISGDDKIFHPAEAIINNNTVLVSSKEVHDPVAVRFAFANQDVPNLFNIEGLPASTFRSDDWSINTEQVKINLKYNIKLDNFTIQMVSRPHNVIRYTLDGNEPTTKSKKYSGELSVNTNLVIKARAIVNNDPSLFVTKAKIKKHLATGKRVTYKTKFSNQYTAGGESGLVNSIFGTTNYQDGNWQGFNGSDMEVVIDLNKKTNVSEVDVNCLQVINSWIVLPKQIEIFAANKNLTFTKVATLSHNVSVTRKEELIQNFIGKFEPIQSRYIKIIATNYGSLPEWHQGAGSKSWLFVDEISIY